MDNESIHSTASETPKCLKKPPFSSAQRELIVTLVRNQGIEKENQPETVERGLNTEIESRKKRCILNIYHNEELHDLRVQREKITIEREKNLLQYEREIHELQKEKLKLEIDVLRNKI